MDAYERDRIASIVHTDCSLIPGANCYNAACFAIDAMEARNKRIDAAAPELLEALRELLECCALENTDGVDEDRMDAAEEQARAAIAKATGA